MDSTKEIVEYYVRQILNDFILGRTTYSFCGGGITLETSSSNSVSKKFFCRISSKSEHQEKTLDEVKEYFNKINIFLDEIESFCSNESREEVITSFLI